MLDVSVGLLIEDLFAISQSGVLDVRVWTCACVRTSMLNQLDNEVNTTAESLNFVMNSLQKLLKTKGASLPALPTSAPSSPFLVLYCCPHPLHHVWLTCLRPTTDSIAWVWHGVTWPADNCQIYTIVALSVTLVILIILVIYV